MSIKYDDKFYVAITEKGNYLCGDLKEAVAIFTESADKMNADIVQIDSSSDKWKIGGVDWKTIAATVAGDEPNED